MKTTFPPRPGDWVVFVLLILAACLGTYDLGPSVWEQFLAALAIGFLLNSLVALRHYRKHVEQALAYVLEDWNAERLAASDPIGKVVP